MNLRHATHPQLVDLLSQLIALKKLSPADLATAHKLVDERHFTRAQKQQVSDLLRKYRFSGAQDAYAIAR